jgi:hypothetical protein
MGMLDETVTRETSAGPTDAPAYAATGRDSCRTYRSGR